MTAIIKKKKKKRNISYLNSARIAKQYNKG